MLWPPPLAGVSEAPGPRPPLGGLWSWRTVLASEQFPRYNSPPHSTRYGRQPEPRRLRRRLPGTGAARGVPYAPCPSTARPRGACREALLVRPAPDADDAQLPFLDPTQYRYELS
jgi:hypothetical protein